ncbi:MAG: hypothetical protein ACHQJX_11550, partial [Candidatus Acidiferrales bacterium]
ITIRISTHSHQRRLCWGLEISGGAGGRGLVSDGCSSNVGRETIFFSSYSEWPVAAIILIYCEQLASVVGYN